MVRGTVESRVWHSMVLLLHTRIDRKWREDEPYPGSEKISRVSR